MTYDMNAARAAANGNARPDTWDLSKPVDMLRAALILDAVAPRLEPDPIPATFLAERPPGELWAEQPPSGQWALMRPTETAIGWLVMCPACHSSPCGWCRLLPDPADRFDYVLDLANGCSHGCEGPEVSWWHLWRSGLLPPHEPLPADERTRRRARGIVRRIIEGVPERPSERQLTGAAYQSGRWLEQGELPAELVADPLLAAAGRAGLDPATIAPKLAAALTAGRAHPGRLPR
jgi:hypothetical protein